MKLFFTLSLSLSLSALLFSSNLLAFTLNNTIEARFPTNDVTVNIADNECQNIGYTNREILELLDDALNNFWNSAPTSALHLKRGSLVAVSDAFYNESPCLDDVTDSTCLTVNSALNVSKNILIACNNNPDYFSDVRILGTTIISDYSITKKEIHGSLFLINDIEGTRVADLSREDMIAYLAHEIGHAIGLGHSPVKDSLMYYQTVERRTHLGYDDIDGVTYLYPLEQPISCGTISLINEKNDSFLNFNGLLSAIFGLFVAFTVVLPRGQLFLKARALYR